MQLCIVLCVNPNMLSVWGRPLRGAENKTKVSEKKKRVQERFLITLGLLVDMPKETTENINEGNTARKIFRNAEISAEIIEVNVELIKRFR
ncbi:hypothetical protein PR048_000945, partial [Dryococelus australis]